MRDQLRSRRSQPLRGFLLRGDLVTSSTPSRMFAPIRGRSGGMAEQRGAKTSGGKSKKRDGSRDKQIEGWWRRKEERRASYFWSILSRPNRMSCYCATEIPATLTTYGFIVHSILLAYVAIRDPVRVFRALKGASVAGDRWVTEYQRPSMWTIILNCYLNCRNYCSGIVVRWFRNASFAGCPVHELDFAQ